MTESCSMTDISLDHRALDRAIPLSLDVGNNASFLFFKDYFAVVELEVADYQVVSVVQE